MPRRKTDKEFKQEVYDLVGNEYIFLDTYVNIMTKLKVKHNKCGNVYEVRPNNFLTGYRCPYCFGNAKKTNAQFKQEVKKLVGNEYTFLDPYVNTKTKLRIKHNNCGNVYKVRPNDFIRGNRCPYCSGKMKKTNSQFQQEVKNLVGGDYVFLDTYVNAKTKIRVKHNKCGNIYEVTPTDFFAKCSRCPYCSMPKTEKIISKVLDMFNIGYEIQKTFEDLVDKSSLSYGFYVPSQNILIEYQGIQHYKPLDLYGGKNAFEIQQKHDKMKADYAKAHHYNLIAIPYTEDTFSKIKKYLVKHMLI